MSDTLQSFVEAHWDNAQIALKNRRWRQAHRDARLVAALVPEIARPLMVCAMSLAQRGFPESALVLMRRAHAAHPGDEMVMTRLSESLFAAGDFSKAEQAIREALRRGTPAGDGHFLLARILWAQGATEEARAALDIAAADNPEIAEKRRILEYTVCPADFA